MTVSEFIDGRLGAAGGPLVSRLLTGTFWSGVASALNQGGTFASAVLIARLLGQTAFGHYAIVLSTLMSVSALAQTGLAYSASKHIAEFRSIDQARTGRILGLCSVLCPGIALVFCLSLAATARFIAGPVLGSRDLSVPLAMGAAFVFFTAMNSYQTGALNGLERYRALVAPSAVSTPLTIGSVAAGALAGGVTGALAGLSAAAALRWYLYQQVLKNELRSLGIEASWRGAKHELRLLYHFAIPATLSGYLMLPALWITNALLVRQAGGYSLMAHYSAAQTVRLMAMFVPFLLNSVGMSILNNVRRGNGASTYAAAHRVNLLILVGATSLGALLLAGGAPWILRIFGHDFAAAGPRVLWILLVSAVVESTMLGLFQPIHAAGRMWTAFLAIIVPWQVAFASAACFLVPRFGAEGLAASHLTGMCVALVATCVSARSIGKHAVIGEPIGACPLGPDGIEPNKMSSLTEPCRLTTGLDLGGGEQGAR